jgi:hypothetical protein
MTSSSTIRIIATGLVLVLAVTTSMPAAADDALREIGDVLQIALPVIGGGATFFTNPDSGATWDRQGTRQFVRAYGSAWVSTYALKGIVSKMRPNGENQTSFPSGHTMSAFAGAGFIDGRYGWKFGAPAYALALLTGVSRVQSSWHYADDVVAGASIGLIANWHFTSPRAGAAPLVPTVGTDGVGVIVDLNATSGERVERGPGQPFGGPGYAFSFGPAAVIRNEIRSGETGADRFDLADFEKVNDPVTTAQANLLIPVGGRGLIWFAYAPFEAKDFGRFDRGTQFGGKVFAADQRIESGWRLHDLNLHYGHDVWRSRRLNLRLGVGLSAQDSYARLTAADGTTATVADTRLFPFFAATLGWRGERRLAVDLDARGIARGDEHILTARAGATWLLSPDWDLGLHYVYFDRRIVTDELDNDVAYDIAHISLTRWWR